MSGRAGFFVRRPRLTAALAVVLLIVGVLAIPSVPVSLYPSVARPSISVSCTYPGANAREVMNTVAGPLEEKMNGVEGMDTMTSSCYDNGSYSMTVKFQVGYDRDVALMKVQSKVQQALSLLPQEVKNTGVTIGAGSTEELGTLTLRSPNGKISREELVDYAFGVINPAILRVPGVGNSTVKDNKVAMRIWLDAQRMSALGIDTSEIVSAIKAQNVQASLGTVGQSPTGASGERVIALISKGRLDSVEEFAKIVVRTESNGGLVRLGDVARIDKGLQAYTYSALYDDQPAVYISIYQLPGVNMLGTMNAIKRQLEELRPVLPDDLAWDMTYDVTRYMGSALRQLGGVLAVALALLLVAGVVCTRSWRLPLVAFLTLPVPLAATFATMTASGLFLNVVTLYAFVIALALAFALALLVILRVRAHAATGLPLQKAAVRAVGDSAFAVFGAALAIAGAMVPVAFIAGVQGVLYRQFSVVLGAAALFGAFNALAIVPTLAARLLKAPKVVVPAAAVPPRRAGSKFIGVALLALGVVTWGLVSGLPQVFIPDEDMGFIYIDCKLAEGTPMTATADVVKKIYERVSRIEGVEKAATILGDTLIWPAGENTAKMTIVLTDWSKRRGLNSRAIARRIEEAVADIAEADLHVLRSPPIPGFGSQGGLCVQIQSLQDADPVRFANEVQRICRELGKSPLAESTNCGTFADIPHLRVNVDREKCELMQVPMSSLYTVLQHYLGSVYVNDINLGTQVNRVTVMSDWKGRANEADVHGLYVRSKAGQMVPVDTLVTTAEELGVSACYRFNQYLYCTMQFIPKPGVSESEAIREVVKICSQVMPKGYFQSWSGLLYEKFRSRGDTGLLIALALFVVYLVLVARCESWRAALGRFLPSVVAVFGAVLLHALSGVPISLYSLFALLLLAVITAALSLAVPAGATRLERALPSVCFALAALPLLFTAGAGSAGNLSLGATLVGGFFADAFWRAFR